MTAFQFLEYAAWALSALFGVLMVLDLTAIDRAYEEDVLVSSKEGEIEDILGFDRPGHGPGR